MHRKLPFERSRHRDVSMGRKCLRIDGKFWKFARSRRKIARQDRNPNNGKVTFYSFVIVIHTELDDESLQFVCIDQLIPVLIY